MNQKENIWNSRLSHALHLQYAEEVKNLLEKYNYGALNLAPQYDAFRACVEREAQRYNVVRKSEFSEEKEEADHARDTVWVGFGATLRITAQHFTPEVREAARRLKIVFDGYNSPRPVAKQPYDAETASIREFLNEVNGKYAADVQTAGLSSWTKELAERNAEFDRLAKAYTQQQAEKPDSRMTDLRRQTDDACKTIVELINADVTRYGEEAYQALLAEWRELVKRYNNLLAQHAGRNKKKTINSEQSITNSE
jgi:hypothetical protein